MPDTRPSIPWVYAVCNDIGPSRATVDRILTADELREQLDDLGDNERVMVIEAGTHAAGDRLRVHPADFLVDIAGRLDGRTHGYDGGAS